MLDLFVERQQYGRPFLAPPGTPPAVVAAYREAFGKVAQDAQFLREADAARLIVKIAAGEDVAARVYRIYDNPKLIIEQATAVLKEGEVCRTVKFRPGAALGWVEAPRGGTFHWARLDEGGRVARYRVVTPSFINWHSFHLAAEKFV